MIELRDRYGTVYILENVEAKRVKVGVTTSSVELNPVLIAASIECIEYVIFHELTHLLHDDHDDEFFRTLKSVYSKYKELKGKLEKETVLFE